MSIRIEHVPIAVCVTPPPGSAGCYLTAKSPPAPQPVLCLGRIQIIVGTGTSRVIPGHMTPPPPVLGAAKIYLSAQEYQALLALIATCAPFSVDITWDDATNLVSAFTFYQDSQVVALLQQISLQLDTGFHQVRAMREDVRDVLEVLRRDRHGLNSGSDRDSKISDVAPKLHGGIAMAKDGS